MRISETIDRVKSKVEKSYTHDRAFIIIFFFAILVRCYEITLPYIKYADDSTSLFAKNFLLYGYTQSHFILFLDVFHDLPHYYIAHPPFFPLIVSFFVKIFGLHEWSFRLVPILFSLGGIILFYFIIKDLWGGKIALFSSFFMSLMPFVAYQDRCIDSFSTVFFFIYLSIYAYLKWYKTNSKKYLLLLIVAVVTGCLTDYYIHLLPPCLLLYSILTKKRLKTMIFVVGTSLSTYIAGIAYVNYYANGAKSLILHHISKTSPPISIFEYIYEISNSIIHYYTLPIILLYIIYITSFIWYLISHKNSYGINREYFEKNLFILIVFSIGIIYILLFPSSVYIDRHALYFLSPFFSITAALGVTKIIDIRYKRKRVILLIVLIIFLICTTSTLHFFHSQTVVDLWGAGKMINMNTDQNDTVLIEKTGIFYTVGYYADRTIRFFRSEQHWKKYSDEEHPKYIVFASGQFTSPHSHSILNSKNYTLIYYSNFLEIWQLHHPPLVEILKTAPPIQYPIKASFSDKMEFLGYDIDKTKFEIGEISHITYYWKCLERMEENYTVFVHFTDKDGKIVFQQEHPFCHGEYPTNDWKEGEMIKEKYYSFIPANVKEGVYNVRIGVYIPHKERLDVILTENGHWDGWRLVIGKINIDMPWEFKYKTHAWLISTLCIYLFFLIMFRILGLKF